MNVYQALKVAFLGAFDTLVNVYRGARAIPKENLDQLEKLEFSTAVYLKEPKSEAA